MPRILDQADGPWMIKPNVDYTSTMNPESGMDIAKNNQGFPEVNVIIDDLQKEQKLAGGVLHWFVRHACH